jgi:hypothetical protein
MQGRRSLFIALCCLSDGEPLESALNLLTVSAGTVGRSYDGLSEFVDVPNGKDFAYAIHEIGRATDSVANYRNETACHPLVDNESPGFLFAGQHEDVTGGVPSG